MKWELDMLIRRRLSQARKRKIFFSSSKTVESALNRQIWAGSQCLWNFWVLLWRKKKLPLWMYFHSRKCDWEELYRSQSWYGNYDEAENLIGEATRSGTFMLWNSLMFIVVKEDSFSRGWQSVHKLQNACFQLSFQTLHSFSLFTELVWIKSITWDHSASRIIIKYIYMNEKVNYKIL